MDDMAEEFGEMLRVCIRLHSDLSQDGIIATSDVYVGNSGENA